MTRLSLVNAHPLDIDGFCDADFYHMVTVGAFEDLRAELVEGKIERMAPAYRAHGRLTFRVASLLEKILGEDAPIGIDLMVWVSDRTVRAVDILVGNKEFDEHQAIRGADIALAVEIAGSTLGKDLGAKSIDYAKAGIAVYWVVDIEALVTHVLISPTANGYAERTAVRFDEQLPVPSSDRTIVIGNS